MGTDKDSTPEPMQRTFPGSFMDTCQALHAPTYKYKCGGGASITKTAKKTNKHISSSCCNKKLFFLKHVYMSL